MILKSIVYKKETFLFVKVAMLVVQLYGNQMRKCTIKMLCTECVFSEELIRTILGR